MSYLAQRIPDEWVAIKAGPVVSPIRLRAWASSHHGATNQNNFWATVHAVILIFDLFVIQAKNIKHNFDCVFIFLTCISFYLLLLIVLGNQAWSQV